MEESLVFIKPDGVRRGLMGRIIQRFEDRGLEISKMTLKTLSGKESDQHYMEHIDREFYPALKQFVTSGPVLIMVIKGASNTKSVQIIDI